MPLKRKEMLEIIRSGGSVSYKGRLISTEERLPSVAELAQTDEDKAAAEGDLDAQIEALMKQKAALNGANSTGKDEKAEREKAFNTYNRKNLDDLKKIAGDMKNEGYPVADFANDATKADYINAILDANEKGKGK